MLKYLYKKVVFSEIPDETSLAIAISGCQIRCRECHSPELWEDMGTPLDREELERLLDENKGVTTVLFMGGEHDIDYLTMLAMIAWNRVKVAWYCGLDILPSKHVAIMQYLNYIKLGHYDPKLGGLSSPATNQKLYKIDHQADGEYCQTDITNLFWKHENAVIQG